MTVMTDKDYRDILDTVYTINSCEDKESFLDILMPSMIQLFNADCVTFQLIQGYPYHIKIKESRSFKSAKHNLNEDKVNSKLYKDSYYHYSPLLKEAISSSKVILKIGEAISLKDWERSDLYNDFILPQNLYWEMFLTLRWRNNLEGMITLWRSKEMGDYGVNDILKAEVLAPHVMLATRNVSSLSRFKEQKSGIIHSEENNTEGMLLLDHKLNPLYFNAKGREICLQMNNSRRHADDGQDDREFSIPESITRDCNDLINLVKLEDNPILWPKERVVLTPSGQKLRVECSLIWKTELAGSQPNFMVILDEIKPSPNSETSLTANINLSKRELEIIYYLNKGLSYDEIGDKLFISKLTVHTHIKNIYRKLGAKSRIELYRYVQPPSWMK